MTEISDADLESLEKLLTDPTSQRLIAIIRTLRAQLELERATMDRIKTDADAAKEGRYPLEDFLNRVLILLPSAPTTIDAIRTVFTNAVAASTSTLDNGPANDGWCAVIQYLKPYLEPANTRENDV